MTGEPASWSGGLNRAPCCTVASFLNMVGVVYRDGYDNLTHGRNVHAPRHRPRQLGARKRSTQCQALTERWLELQPRERVLAFLHGS